LQRLKLVSQIENSISGVLYILDEPTAGLHPKDYSRLINAIGRLRDNGNTILLVEHNRDLIHLADKLIDIGPKAGKEGGYRVASGTLSQIMLEQNSLTGKYLSGEQKINIPQSSTQQFDFVKLSEIKYNNLKNISIEFPKGKITCITGISGSGKSSLMKGVISPSAIINKPINCNDIQNSQFSKVVMVDQSAIGKTPRSVPATYMGIMDIIRQLFEEISDLSSSHFSFNSSLGQCENCHGDGEIKAEFMPGVWIKCPVCTGKRYKQIILDIRLRERNIFEVLEMTIEESANFFVNTPKLHALLSTLCEVGLGYLKLGQNSATLSNGEAQRLKLAKSLTEISKNNVLYLFDEPTTGLHFSDIQDLLLLLRSIADKGNTIIIVEHNMDVIKNADWIIDLGPEGGTEGGYLVAQGTPSDIQHISESYTAQYLR
jgi:excinuclease ABC subunit A